jgi:hypothetical protein
MSEPTTSDGSSEEVPCPHCNHMITDLWDYHWNHDTIETTCEQCDRTIIITRQVTVGYTARPASSTS